MEVCPESLGAISEYWYIERGLISLLSWASAPGFHAAIFCLPFIYLRSRSTEWAKEGLLAVSLVFRYPLYDVQKAQTTTETTRCAIVFAHVTYDTIQNGAEMQRIDE